MDPLSFALAPPRLLLRALDDLHVLASTAARTAESRETIVARLEAVERVGRDLVEAAGSLRDVSADVRDAAARLTVSAEVLDRDTRRVAEVGASVDAIAETVEPLQGAAERVGRMTRRRR